MDTTQEINEQIEAVINEFSEDGDFQQLAVILNMEGEEFNIISNTFLNELEKQLRNPSQFFAVKHFLNSYSMSTEEFLESSSKLIDALNSVEDYDQPKKDFIRKFVGILANAVTNAEDAYWKYLQIPTVLEDGAKLPVYAHETDAGADVYSMEDIDIDPGHQHMIKTGIHVSVPKGYAILVQPRSGMSAKTKLRIANTPGLIDSGYTGEIKIIMENTNPPIKDLAYSFNDDGEVKILSILHGESYHISVGDKIAQLRLVAAPQGAFYEVDSLIETDRGNGGFGSTGK